MAKKVLVPMAEGFEEIEAITVIDVLRRAEVEVVVAGLAAGPVKGSRGVVVVPDTTMEEAGEADYDAVVLPAICAAPSVVLDALGYLKGKRATCHPAFAKELTGYSPDRVVSDGILVTSQAPGTALEFSLELVARLASPAKAAEIKKATVAA